ncbi:MAG: hypothetical protein MJ102_05485, partial [Clostridia bacterium]|nr:hypothetical protein [Clostridia bacterium]
FICRAGFAGLDHVSETAPTTFGSAAEHRSFALKKEKIHPCFKAKTPMSRQKQWLLTTAFEGL